MVLKTLKKIPEQNCWDPINSRLQAKLLLILFELHPHCPDTGFSKIKAKLVFSTYNCARERKQFAFKHEFSMDNLHSLIFGLL